MTTESDQNPLPKLVTIIRTGLPSPGNPVKETLAELFGGRYHKRHESDALFRDAYALAGEDGAEGVPWAGIIHGENPPSGPYGGASLVWFPSKEGSLIGFCVGTRGLSPDEGILTRPGHRRRVAALRRYLSRLGVEAWTKPDPSALGLIIPKTARDRFAGFERSLKRYEREMYCVAKVPSDDASGTKVVQAFLDLYAYERGWKPLAKYQEESDWVLNALRADLFPAVSEDGVNKLLRERRFVVLQGPPGTGKTRLAEQLRAHHFAGHGMTVQFHPAVTYEDFLVGMFPVASGSQLSFDIRPGWLLQAAKECAEKPFLLVIDEINRADLGKILGEAIYLFEAGNVGGVNARTVRLAHALNGEHHFQMPENLFVLGTMNTADRSIAGMDLAVRRRFAFVSVPPDRNVVAAQGLDLATRYFDRLADVFVEHAPDDALDLLPGHAYFLASDEDELKRRFRYELVPLLDEYLRQGFLGPASTEIQAVRDSIEDEVGRG